MAGDAQSQPLQWLTAVPHRGGTRKCRARPTGIACKQAVTGQRQQQAELPGIHLRPVNRKKFGILAPDPIHEIDAGLELQRSAHAREAHLVLVAPIEHDGYVGIDRTVAVREP